MAVYIKGRKIPKSCYDCEFVYWSTKQRASACFLFPFMKCFESHSTKYREKRSEHCPLIEVPEPHGRLGDLDALMLIIREYIDEYGELDENGFHSEKWCAMKEAEMVICEAPTIIPASEEGE